MSARRELAHLAAQTARAVSQQRDDGVEAIFLPEGLDAVLKTPRPPAPDPSDPAAMLDALYRTHCTCTKCGLGHTRRHFVFGSGNPQADVMFIGEAPGAEEDARGYPFVGAAGRLLTSILKAIDFERDDVYIANILKCRPPNNRNPQPDEIAACEPILREQIRRIRPGIICALGRIAGQALLGSTTSLGRMRGRFHDYHGIKLLVTYHPAALLRNPSFKRPTWDDVRMLRREYDRMRQE